VREGPELSIVIPFYNEADVLPLLRQSFEQTGELPEDREVIFVSDGSTDGGENIVEQWAGNDPRVKLVVLSRNFGHQAAISAGVDLCSGNFVGVMDADLQDTPQELVKMYQQARAEKLDVVFSIRSERREALHRKAAYKIFYWLYAFISDSPVQSDSGDFCVLSRRAVDKLKSMPERVRFVRGLRSWLGLRQKGIPSTRPARAAGVPKYSLTKLVSLALAGITSFSIKPLRIATLFGIFLSVVSIGAAFVYFLLFLFMDLHVRVPGFTTLVLLVLLLNGLQFLMVGILGEYVGRIYWEVKGRPTYLIDRTINLPLPLE
jgi:dolichol-phosphate mannosyltransferase